MLTLRLFVQITSVKHSNILACLDPLPQGKSTVRNTKVYGLAAAFVNLGRMFGPYGTQKRSAVVRSRTVHGYAPEFVDYFLPHVWTMPQRKVVPSEVVERMALRFSLCDFPLFLAECLVIFDGEK